VKIDPREEWREVFHEAWPRRARLLLDPNMTGHNWKKIGERYEALLPWVAHRSDLNYIIGEMIAELSTSHTMWRRRSAVEAACERWHARRRFRARRWILPHLKDLSWRELE